MSAHEHLSLLRLIQPRDHLDERRFCTARTADDADGLAGADRQIDIGEHRLLCILMIAEGNVAHLDRTVRHGQRRVRCRVANIRLIPEHLADPVGGRFRHHDHNEGIGNHHQGHENLRNIADEAHQLACLHGAEGDQLSAEPDDGDDAGIHRKRHQRAIPHENFFGHNAGSLQVFIGDFKLFLFKF